MSELKNSQNICASKVISYTKVKELNCFIVVCVESKGARGLIRNRLNDLVYIESKDYICAA